MNMNALTSTSSWSRASRSQDLAEAAALVPLPDETQATELAWLNGTSERTSSSTSPVPHPRLEPSSRPIRPVAGSRISPVSLRLRRYLALNAGLKAK